MPKFNVIWAVVDVIDADDETAALSKLRDRLSAADFEPYEGTPDLVPDGYKLACLSDDDETPPPTDVLARKITPDDVATYPGYFISGPGREIAERTQCAHGYNLTDSCPGCDADKESVRGSWFGSGVDNDGDDYTSHAHQVSVESPER